MRAELELLREMSSFDGHNSPVFLAGKALLSYGSEENWHGSLPNLPSFKDSIDGFVPAKEVLDAVPSMRKLTMERFQLNETGRSLEE